MLYLDYITSYVPPYKVEVENNLEQLRITQIQAKVYSKLFGLKAVPIAKDMTTFELLKKSVDKIFLDTNIARDKIKLLIHTHTGKIVTPFGDPSPAKKLCEHLNLNQALSFGISVNNCASNVSALEIASKILREFDGEARAIITTGDLTYTHILRIIPNTTILGSSSSAVLVKLNGDRNLICNIAMKVYGKFSPGYWMDSELALEYEANYSKIMRDTIIEVVTKYGITLNDIKIILPHNVNYISWLNIMKLLNMPLSKIFLKNIERYGHCFGADIMMNYVSVMRDNIIKKGDFYVMATAGIGGIFAAILIQH